MSIPLGFHQFLAVIEKADFLVYEDLDGAPVLVDSHGLSQETGAYECFSHNQLACEFRPDIPIELSDDGCRCTSNDGTNTIVTLLFTPTSAAEVMTE